MTAVTSFDNANRQGLARRYTAHIMMSYLSRYSALRHGFSWLLVVLWVVPAQADEFRDGIEAYDQGNYSVAFEILDSLALDGDPRALGIAG